MKISTKGRYGLRAMIDLAIYSSNGHQALGQIAQRQNVSEIYLEQVFSALRKNNMVQSVKGAQGGYLLAVDPKDVTAGDILRVLEGDVSIIDYGNEDVGAEHSKLTTCINDMVWRRIDANIRDLVDGITLEEMVEDYKKKLGLHAPMYYI
ncbi:Rrf2 family transcriptional regulator [Alkalibacter rhizosphaerae]|uniref:Rrf2 family transcriptional regulator n=1 Tax=Alkalibacter rhizosphaerae TaxID=2815577 RepID=A0A975AHI4_9FIRM|nr:Rrf2 family transcriptional regulator [Alkalibacter rhizosphaerae]QSX07525.1 Rrf2 family transcriptional regulator [Alkalibacter rhizosphaerae]